MARGINTSTKTALSSDSFRLATLITFNFDTVIRLTDFGKDLVVSANTYTSSGHLIDIGDMSESARIQVGSLELNLSGVDQAFINLFLYGAYLDVGVAIDRAVIDTNDAVVGSPFTYFDGRIVGYKIEDNKQTSNLVVELASHWKDFEKINCRRTNSNSQHRYFPDDKGFDFASKSIDSIKWGRE